MKELHFGILGTGMVADYHKTAIEANADLGARFSVVSHYDPTRFGSLSEKFGVPCVPYEALLADEVIDVICICTPSGQHANQALAALNRRKHVIVEKPMALSVSDAHAMIAAAEENGVCLSVALQRRTDPLFNTVYRAVQNGDFGEITLASVVMPYFRGQAYYDQAHWRGTWALDGGGVLMNQGIHIVDLLVWFLGDPVHVQARAGTLHRNIEVEDVAAAVLQFEGGALASLSATTTVGGGAPHRIELYGTNGAIQIEGEGVVRWEMLDKSRATVPQPAVQTGSEAGAGADPRGISTAGHTSIVRELILAIREGRSPSIDGHEGMRSLAAIHAIYAAAGIEVPA